MYLETGNWLKMTLCGKFVIIIIEMCFKNASDGILHACVSKIASFCYVFAWCIDYA